MKSHHLPRPQLKSAALVSLALALALMLPFAAMAQATAEDFQPDSNDLTGYMLRSVFGVWGSGELVPVLGPAMRVFNIFALTFGTLMFTYVAVIGTLNSAQDGEILGRKWSSMWVPLRFVAGTAMLVPLASGYSTAQHLILWLAMAGGGGASAVWDAALSGFANPMTSAQAVQESESYHQRTNSLARNLLQAEVCTEMLARGSAAGATFGMTSAPQPSTYTGTTQTVGGHRLFWGPTSAGTDYAPDHCGSVTMPQHSNTITPESDAMTGSSFQAAAAAGSTQAPATPSGAVLTAEYERLATAQFNGVRAAVARVAPVATALANGATLTDAEINAAVLAAGREYRALTREPNQAVVNASAAKLSQFIASSRESGWLMASSSFFQLARIRSAANTVVDTIPAFDKKNSASSLTGAPQGVAEGPLYEDMKAVDSRINTAFAGNSDDKWYFNIGKRLAQNSAEIFSVNPSSHDHPLVQIKDKGDRLLVAIEVAATGSVLAVTAANAASDSILGKAVNTVTGLGTAFKEMVTLLTPAFYLGFMALFAVAITMSFLIPMLPFMLSIGAVLGWLMAVFSAVVAAPVWLAGHLHPEGDGFAGKAVGGYMILLETITRPLFIVFGLIGSFAIMGPLLTFVSWAFRANLSSVQGDSITGILSVIVFAVLYVSIVFTVVRTSLSLMHVLSENVYRWIGGQYAGYEQARDFGNAAQQSAATATGGIKQIGGAVAGNVAARKAQRAKLKGDANSTAPTGDSSEGRS